MLVGSWLKAIPTVPELSIPSDKMAVITLRLFQGIPMQKEMKECPICRKRIDDFNVQHMLLCSRKKVLMQCYDAINHCVKDLCVAAGLHVDVEASPFMEGRESHLRRKTRGSPDLIII